jgi:hypothetical protein
MSLVMEGATSATAWGSIEGGAVAPVGPACAKPALTVWPLRHFAQENCALGEDAISCTACLAHEGTKPR